MAEKRCDKCGEMVDEAKAFCPGCGDSFVDERQRTSVSDFDQSNRTVQLGETMFNQMLSEMGLNISKQPNREDNNSDIVAPLVPIAAEPSIKPKGPPSTAPAKRTNTIRIIAIAAAVVVFAIVVMLATFAGLMLYYR